MLNKQKSALPYTISYTLINLQTRWLNDPFNFISNKIKSFKENFLFFNFCPWLSWLQSKHYCLLVLTRRSSLQKCRMSIQFQFICTEQGFPTFFGSRHSCMVKKHFGGTPSYNILAKKAAPVELFRAPKGVAAPRLGTSGTERLCQRFRMN